MTISLAINSKDPNPFYIEEMLRSAKGFDEIVLYLDHLRPLTPLALDFWTPEGIRIVRSHSRFNIAEGFNFAISQTHNEWVCSFCDDDVFNASELANLLSAMREDGFGDNADIIHFPVTTNDGIWGTTPSFSLETIRDNNLIPHGSFFRKDVWKYLGGYKLDPGADWNFWIRAKAVGFRFKFWPQPVYYFRQGTGRSAWAKQVGEFGFGQIKRMVNEIT